ncbi:MAG: HAD-IC family P-type ATPase [Candidatus Bathyarchaeia archaeon]
MNEGEPAVTDIISVGDYSREEVLELASIAEKGSEHPLAEAISKAAKNAGLSIPDADFFEVIPGEGVKILYKSRQILLGNKRIMKNNMVDISHVEGKISELEEQGKTVMLLAINGRAAGLIAAMDMPKEEAAETIRELKEMGLEVIMLTGDNERTARAIAKQLGINSVIANVLSWEKVSVIKRLRDEDKVVAIVGDGINDAPALAQADIGIAIGSGTDIAKEAGGIILVKDDLRDVAKAIKLSKATIRKIKQNLFWALIYNTLSIPIAAAGLLTPLIAAGAMAFSSLFVTINSATLKLQKI